MRLFESSFLAFSLLVSSSAFLSGCASADNGQKKTTANEVQKEAVSTDVSTSSPAAGDEQSRTFYFAGTTSTTSPDGKTPFGPSVAALAKRVFHMQNGTIEEEVLVGGKMETVVMHRVAQTGRFEVAAGEAFSGDLTFVGEPWQWTSWTYNLVMADGSGTIVGEGTLVGGKMNAEKFFVDGGGVKRARIIEELSPITAEEYASRVKVISAIGQVESDASE